MTSNNNKEGKHRQLDQHNGACAYPKDYKHSLQTQHSNNNSHSNSNNKSNQQNSGRRKRAQKVRNNCVLNAKNVKVKKMARKQSNNTKWADRQHVTENEKINDIADRESYTAKKKTNGTMDNSVTMVASMSMFAKLSISWLSCECFKLIKVTTKHAACTKLFHSYLFMGEGKERQIRLGGGKTWYLLKN